ncbi:ABC transporter substrate-binding protein [Nocardioides albidus]|uniref:ABC transporter substrate-binding protein n=1 Tax=Nocardioides albidus TaxID=1517589 RepID=A0A5C4W3G0_9ACTN|nr:ABC transporter substrate-binding protein [Nocardioides albidus]TNM42722.1 ABC transporter substrate-binding protein [Nocardioides albidus]
MEQTRRGMLKTMGSAAIVASAGALPVALASPSTAATSGAAAAAATTAAGAAPLTIRLLLNSGLSGPHAFFCLAKERGYFSDAGLDVQFVAGAGASGSVPVMAVQGYEAGYGDFGSLVKVAAMRPHESPVAVHMTFSATPLTIGVRKGGRIRKPRHLEGKVITGNSMDTAIEILSPYAVRAGFDESRLSIMRSPAALSVMAKDVVDGHVDGVFGFVNTIIAALASIGIDGRKELDFLEYRDVLPDFFGNALMVAPSLIRDHPDAVRAFVAGVNRGIADTYADPDAALRALERQKPDFRWDVDGPRLLGTLENEMAHPDTLVHGIGDVTNERLHSCVRLLVDACRLPHPPAPHQVFSRDFLPPLDERARPVF